MDLLCVGWYLKFCLKSIFGSTNYNAKSTCSDATKYLMEVLSDVDQQHQGACIERLIESIRKLPRRYLVLFVAIPQLYKI